ncbi:MAG TPA: hypothetical protein VMU67_01265 [Steroidobacteraceae bacterium]|nr:hypothetical protein [Steroidobacteraceae bacterium]
MVKSGKGGPIDCAVRDAIAGSAIPPAARAAPQWVETMRRRVEAEEQQRTAQQGLGKPISSAEVAGHRVVAIGNTVHFSKGWRTFPDFLSYMVGRFFGGEWGNAELRKSEEEMHPIALWYRRNALLQAKHAGKPGEVFSTPETGAARAFLELGYNLYLLEHNAELQQRLINRLKQRDQFLGVLSELRVAGFFVRAGFSVKFHDETDRTTSHCEYDGRRIETGKTFSVEVKTRHWTAFPKNDAEGRRAIRGAVADLLFRALKKHADAERIVFVELAMPDEDSTQSEGPWWRDAAMDAIRAAAERIRAQGREPPSATVVVSNFPYHYHLESTRAVVSLAVDGIGPTDFRAGLHGTVREALHFRERHVDFLALWNSIEAHRNIPATFDGSSGHLLSVDGQAPRLLVGERYEVPDADGATVLATLVDAIAVPTERRMYGIYQKASGEQIICHVPMTDAEAKAYAEQPDTFFGVVKKQGSLKGPLELYDFFWESYRNTPKGRLLEFMAPRPDLPALSALPQQELAEIYCEGLVHGVLAQQAARTGGNSTRT